MLAFAFSPTSIPVLALLFVAVGTSTALVETAEGSHAPELLPEAIRGRAFGLIGLVDGVGDLESPGTSIRRSEGVREGGFEPHALSGTGS